MSTSQQSTARPCRGLISTRGSIWLSDHICVEVRVWAAALTARGQPGVRQARAKSEDHDLRAAWVCFESWVLESRFWATAYRFRCSAVPRGALPVRPLLQRSYFGSCKGLVDRCALCTLQLFRDLVRSRRIRSPSSAESLQSSFR